MFVVIGTSRAAVPVPEDPWPQHARPGRRARHPAAHVTCILLRNARLYRG